MSVDNRPMQVRVEEDGRPLHVRVEALARRFDAIAIGAKKRADASIQDYMNATTDAGLLHEAARELEAKK